MFKNLCSSALGVSGRQSEIIELALTYGFRGMDVDLMDLAKRAKEHGVQHACRFIKSAKIKIGGFPLPIHWQADEATFKADLVQFDDLGEIISTIQATRCYTTIEPASDERPYHENFEFHRVRLAETAEVLAKHNVRLGLALRAAPEHREGKQYQFVFEYEPLMTLIQTIGQPNVGLVLDLWDWQVSGLPLEQIRQLDVRKLVGVRLADLPPDADRSTVTEKQRLVPGEVEDSPLIGALTALAEMQYEGPVTPLPHTSRLTGLTRDAIVHRVGSAMDQLFRAAGISKSGRLTAATGS